MINNSLSSAGICPPSGGSYDRQGLTIFHDAGTADSNDGGSCCRDLKKPRVAVVDEFAIPTVDLNLDGVKDLPHGRIVETIISCLVDADIVRFTNDEPVKVLTEFLPEQLAHVAEEGNFDSVNISAGMHKSLRILARKTGISDLGPQNVDQYREKIRNYYRETGEEGVSRVFDSIEKLTAAGVKVYVAGGNKGPDYVNLFGFARGAVNVGAVNHENQPVITSARNSMLRYDQGVYGVSPVFDPGQQVTGYDIDGSGTVEFKADEVSTGPSRVEEYRDKPLDMVLAGSHEYDTKISCDRQPFQCPVDKNDPLRHHLFSVAELAERGAIPPADLDVLLANHYEYVTFDNKLHFRADDARIIRFDPDGSGRPGLIGFIRGTSFAAPAALAHDMLAETENA